MIQRLRSGSLLLLCIILFSTSSVFSQNDLQKSRELLQTDSKVKAFTINEQLLTPSFISFREAADLKTPDGPVVIKKYFNLGSAANQLRLLRTDELKSGIRVEHYMDIFNGVPVEHSSYVVMSRNGNILSVNAESYSLKDDFSILPTLSADAGLAKALAFVNARRYAWEDLEQDKARAAGDPLRIQQIERSIQEYFPKGELVIAKNIYGDGQARLAWKFDVYATEPLSRNYVYVDAMNGNIILKDAIIKHAGKKTGTPVTNTIPETTIPLVLKNNFSPFRFLPYHVSSELGTGATRYAGTRNFFTTRLSVPAGGMNDPNNNLAPLQYSGVDPRVPVLGPIDVFILKDDTRGGGIETYDMNGVGGLPVSVPSLQLQALAFLDKDNNWINTGAGTNEDHIRGTTSNGSNGADEALNDDYALDAHWGAEMVYDYWKIVHNRFSFDNQNSAIKSFVHYGPAYDNAFWNGTVMTYGDGSGTIAAGFRPLTSLDVCGHEIGHGVCSHTADLVYAGESGAMNEALSDIWAACIERFVKTTVDPSLPYQYFQIGEQIAADNIGLRRMDDPKAYSNPDTYGGQYWSNPVCTPTLANDECGVHNNSGLLNKWFYLLVQGPLTTTGAPGYTDDGLADNGAIVNGGNNYGALGPSGTGEFLGIGFDEAQAIVYLTELTLTPNATYANARVASINAARALYGECSQEEKSVTDAWFGIGVGASYAGCALPLLSVYTLQTDVKETAGGACDRYNEYNINVNLTTPQPGGVTVNFAVGSTTMSADEYSLSAGSVTYTSVESGLRTVKLRIYDDAMVESDETIDINVTSASPVLNTSFTFTVRNDDLDPVIGGTQTLLNEDFESTAVGSLPAGWAEIDKTVTPPIRWTVRSNGTIPLNWSGKRAIVEQTLLPGQATYDQLTESQIILKTPLINATGLNSVRVQFVYQAGGEPACDPACDYGQLVYSFDGTTFNSLPGATSPPMYVQLTDANYDYILPTLFNGKQFYLGILWTNDANGGTSTSITLDNFMITGKGRAIESELNAAVSERVNAETGKPSYFYSIDDGELIARISNSTAHNYGCVNASLEKAGGSAFELYVDGTDHHRIGDKIVRVTPASNNPAGNYTITLYFTEAEISAIESFTGFTRNQLFIYKTSAIPYTGATAANTVRQAAIYTAIPGVGGSFTANFATGFSAFALGAPVSIALPVSCIDFKVSKINNAVHLQWKVSDNSDNAGFEIERSIDGINYVNAGSVNANPANGGNYSFDDMNSMGSRDVYYRLKQADRNGSFRYICTILKITLDGGNDLTIGKIYPNPVGDEAFVNVFTMKTIKLQMEYMNATGQLIQTQTELLQPGIARIQLRPGINVSGTYMIRFRNENGVLLGTQTYVRQ